MVNSGMRTLTSADLDALMRLKDSANWNQTRQDWLRLLKLAPDGCFGIEVDGILAASTTAVSYGNELAWIGMVLTLPEHRRKGLAAKLMEHALRHVEAKHVRCIKLDATDMGRPLYERFGFHTECAVERWRRSPGGEIACTAVFKQSATLDRQAFGADRSALLAQLASEGCTLGRPGSNAAYFGPCVAASADQARMALESYLAGHAHEPVFWDLLPNNEEAVQLAQAYQFVPVRRLHRMALGEAIPGDSSKVFAIAGFEYG